VGLAEAERGESLQHLPDTGDGCLVVATGARCCWEPGSHLLLALGVTQGASSLVRLGQAAPGDDRDDGDHLLVEHHDPAGLAQHRLEVGMQVLRHLPPLA
jgi:hypothetical protein